VTDVAGQREQLLVPLEIPQPHRAVVAAGGQHRPVAQLPPGHRIDRSDVAGQRDP
jgi:hypothetical protein